MFLGGSPGFMALSAWEIGGAVFSGDTADVSDHVTVPSGLFFNATGTRLYVGGGSDRHCWQYTLTAWNLATPPSFSGQIDVSTQVSVQARDVALSSDGSKVYSIGLTQDKIFQYTLPTPFEFTGETYSGKSLTLGSQEGSARSLKFRDDGSAVYIVGDGNTVYQYTLGTPWDLSTGSYASKSKSVSSQCSNANGIAFKPDGTKMYVTDYGSKVYQYTLSTPWDVSTASYDGASLNFAAQASNGNGLFFKPDGTALFIVDATSKTVYKYNLS